MKRRSAFFDVGLFAVFVTISVIVHWNDLMAGMDPNVEGCADDVQYGLPWTSSTPLMSYNAELAEQPGINPETMPTKPKGNIAFDTDARQQMYVGKLGINFSSTVAVRSFEREIDNRFARDTARMPKMADGGGAAAGGGEYLLHGAGPEAQALVVENTGYMPVNNGAMDVLADFYAEQTDRAYPWFGRPGQNGARISQVVLDDMAVIASDQMTSDEAATDMSDRIAR